MRNKDVAVTKTEILHNVWDAHYDGRRQRRRGLRRLRAPQDRHPVRHQHHRDHPRGRLPARVAGTAPTATDSRERPAAGRSSMRHRARGGPRRSPDDDGQPQAGTAGAARAALVEPRRSGRTPRSRSARVFPGRRRRSSSTERRPRCGARSTSTTRRGMPGSVVQQVAQHPGQRRRHRR